MMLSKKLLKTSLLAFLFLNFILIAVHAQVQTTPFSGNSASSYQCIGDNGQIDPSAVPKQATPGTGDFLCPSTKYPKAILKPVALQQIEIWFVRIIYIIWALVGTYSFILLVYLGYQYMLRGGTSDTQLVELRRRIIYYIIGFALVFLAIPILSTFFRLLNINTTVDCYNVNVPTFQFFFANLCTDPNKTLVDDPCAVRTGGTDPEGLACPSIGASGTTCHDATTGIDFLYVCVDPGIWHLEGH